MTAHKPKGGAHGHVADAHAADTPTPRPNAHTATVDDVVSADGSATGDSDASGTDDAEAIAATGAETDDETDTEANDTVAMPTDAGDEARLVALQATLEKSHADYLRARAEAENVRRRAETEVGQARKFALEHFARDVLVVRDSLEQASLVQLGDTAGVKADDGVKAKGDAGALLGTMREGLQLTLQQLDALFAQYSIVGITPEPGDVFDAARHQALSAVPSAEHAPNHIVQRIQTGYLLHERLLRPATVIVARAGREEDAKHATSEDAQGNATEDATPQESSRTP